MPRCSTNDFKDLHGVLIDQMINSSNQVNFPQQEKSRMSSHSASARAAYQIIPPNEPATLSGNEDDKLLDPLDLRRAFAQFGTGVTVVTAQAQNGLKVGVTANSFNTVSLSPPIVLWSLSCRSPSLAVYRSAGHFAVNILSLAQIDLSRRFSQPSTDRFHGLNITHGHMGAPILEHCSAVLECVTLSEQTVGDHVLFLGKVERYSYADQAPLLFYNGQYVQSSALI
jgi:flavin reductase (DIM6/NTAB) family NADH-FMN oxidoreductase RutF